MAIKITDEGQIELLKHITGVSSAVLTFRLFQNNFTPSITSTNSSFTEATFSGYMSQPTTWGAVFQNGSDQAESDGSGVTFSRGVGGTSNTIYGWYITCQPLSGTVSIAADVLATPKVMAVSGDGITLTPKIRLYRE